jgi:putative membrane protein
LFAGALFLAASGALAQGAGPTDPQIAHIVVTANQVDIDAGTLAQSKGGNKDVKAFGKQTVSDHKESKSNSHPCLHQGTWRAGR